MSRFIAKTVYQWVDQDNNTIVSFVVEPGQSYAAKTTIDELKNSEIITVDAKKHHDSRTNRQNRMLWSLMTQISLVVNHSKRKEDVENIYADLLEKANIIYIDLPVIEESAWVLREQFRLVIKKQEKSTDKKGKKYQWYRCYVGSSSFDTKEMNQLLDIALDRCTELGIEDSEIESIRGEYKV